MFWHILRLDFNGVEDSTRDDIEDRLEGLDSLDEVAWLRMAHDVTDAEVTAFVTGFENRDDYEAYRVHPDHVPVVMAIETAEVEIQRMDFETDDEVERWSERGGEDLP